jgi:hypothetical protein
VQLESEVYNVPGGAREIAAQAEQFRNQGDNVKARFYFEAALKQEPHSQWIRAHLAETLAAIAARSGMDRRAILEEAVLLDEEVLEFARAISPGSICGKNRAFKYG